MATHSAIKGNAANQSKKADEVAMVRERFSRAVAAVFVDFRGVNVELITELRSRFRERGIEYRVVKNTLVEKAFEGTKLEGNSQLLAQLKGPTGIAWTYEDPSAAAKVIKEFRKEGEAQEKLTVKCGLLDTEVLTGSRVESELAALPSKDELRARLLAQLLAPMQALVRQLQAPAQNFVYVLDAKQRRDNG